MSPAEGDNREFRSDQRSTLRCKMVQKRISEDQLLEDSRAGAQHLLHFGRQTLRRESDAITLVPGCGPGGLCPLHAPADK